jgi:hypothetical protein
MPTEDSFTLFRKKKEAERAAQLAAKAAASAAAAEPQEAGRPKGFRRGRFAKPQAPVQGVAPKGLKAFRKSRAAGPAAPKPRGFDRMRAAATPVDPATLEKPAGFDPGRIGKPFGTPADAAPPPLGFQSTRAALQHVDPSEVPRPKGFRRY